MADRREDLIVETLGARPPRHAAAPSLPIRAKLALRRFVVATANSPLRPFYLLVYRAHVWHGVRTIRRLPGVRAIYVTRGVASGDITPGISDVDFAVFGDWTDTEHAHVSDALRRLSASSPLYERGLAAEARTVDTIRPLYDSDFLLMTRFDEGRLRWTLQYGEPVLDALPPPPAARLAGGYYMELRLWWSYFTRTAFGTSVLATDPVFHDSLCYKVATESLAKIHGLAGDVVEPTRAKALARALPVARTEDRPYLERLQRSAGRRWRGHDVREETFAFMTDALERVHASIAGRPPFDAMADVAPARIDAVAAEVPRAPGTMAHVARIVAHAKAAWPGYRAAFLSPCLACYNPDDLVLLLDVSGSRPPHAADIRALADLHRETPLSQRVTLCLLLEHGVYQIEEAHALDLWRLLMCRASNPEVFALIARSEFALDGPPRSGGGPCVWTRFAAALVDEELGVRRAAIGKVSAAPDIAPLDLLRNIWRHLQLEIIADSTRRGRPVLPMTPMAIARAVVVTEWLEPVLLEDLRASYEAALGGVASDVRPLLDRLMNAFARRGHSSA